MAASGSISGVGVGIVTGGALLMYAGLTDQTPLQALRAVASGAPGAVPNRPGTTDSLLQDLGQSLGSAAGSAAAAGGGLPQLPGALEKFAADKYSKAYRNRAGYSDCSSFIGKGLRAIGITPPGPSVTGSYLASRQWKRIPRAQAGAGDLAVTPLHMCCFINNSIGIGQQNRSDNVQTGPVDTDLMYGNTPFAVLRYAGSGVLSA